MMIIKKEDVLKVLTVWMIFKLESIITTINMICVKMNKDLIP